MQSTIHPSRQLSATRSDGEFAALVAQVKDAIEGNSNAAEFQALIAVAEFFGVEVDNA